MSILGNCSEVICCGDLCSPFIVKQLGEGLQVETHIVFGNNDADRYRMMVVGGTFSHLKFHGEYVELERDGRLISVNHFDNIGRAIARAPGYDLVCFGHNHKAELSEKPSGDGWVLNPGEVYGQLSGKATVATYDTLSGQAELISL